MADASRTIEVIFEGVDRMGAATQSAINNTRSFSSNVEDATAPIAGLAENALKLEAALLVAGAAVVGFSVKVASDFQSAVADLQKVLSDTDDIEQYKDLALELSEAYGQSSVDVLNSITNYKQAGFSAEEAGILTKRGLDLVIAGSVEAAESADLLVASIKGFGAEASDSAQLVDLLNEVSNNFATNTQELLVGFSELSPIARTAGFSLQETIAVLTPGIEVFRSGSEVATALRSSFLFLTQDTDKVRDALAALKVEQVDANGELRSARDIYFDVASALLEMDDNQQLFYAGQLVGKNRVSQFLATVRGLSTTLEIAGADFDFVGSAAKEVSVQLATASVSADRAKAAFINLLGEIGAPLIDEFTGIGDAIRGIFASIGDSAGSNSGIGELVRFVEEQAAGLEDTLAKVAENLPAALEGADFNGFIRGIQAVTGSVSDLFSNIDLTSAEGLVELIEFLGAAFEGLSEFTAGIVDSFKPLFNQFARVASGVADLDKELFRSAGNFAGIVEQINLFARGLNALLPAVEALVAVIGINQAASLFGSLKAGAAVLGGPSGVVAGLAGLASAIGRVVTVAAPAVGGFAIGTAINDLAETVTGSSISSSLVDLGERLGLFGEEYDELVTGIESTTSVASTAAKSIDDLSGSVDAAGESVQQAATLYNIYTGEVLNASELNKTLIGSNRDLEKSYDGIEGVTGAAGDAISTLAEKAKNADDVLKELIQAQASVAIAQIEADAKKVESAFESISTTVETTGKSLDNLFNLLGNENVSKLEKLEVFEQIEKQNQIQEEAVALQNRFTQELIKNLRARTNALKSNSPLITVQGDGLAPHLEAIMFDLFEKVQVRVNNDGYAMLLGAV